MTRLVWDKTGPLHYEAGVDRGVFYPLNGPGQAWNGLVSVVESPSDVDDRPRYLDGVKIGNRRRRGEFSATIEAFSYPITSGVGMVTPLNRTHFSMSYRVMMEVGYKLHLVYNALASPSDKNYVYNETDPFSWSITTRGVMIESGTIVSHLVIDSTQAYPETMAALEDMLYGSSANEPQLPSPDDVLEIFEENSILRIIDHGDGTWTAIGPDDVISMLDPTTFQIDYSTAVYINEDTYTIHSL